MPQCAFKSCKNNYNKNNLSHRTSYFRFPSDPLLCAKWVSIVANERKEENYKVTKYSGICSLHFDEKDIIGNQERRKLRNSAVPKLEVQSQIRNDIEIETKQTESSVQNDRLNNSDDKNNLSVSPPYQCEMSVEVKVESLDEDKSENGCLPTNPFTDTTKVSCHRDRYTNQNNGSAIDTITNSSEQENDHINIIQVNEKYPDKPQGDNKEKIFYIRKEIPQKIKKQKNRTIVKQYSLTIGTIMKGIEEQSKENVKECDKYLDICCRNMYGQFRNITLSFSFYDEEINKALNIWGNWYNVSPLFRSTPLMYKCYICYKGWWRLHPFKEHLKEHSHLKFYLGEEVIGHEFNVIACTKKVIRMENVKMDSNCWKCGRDAAFHKRGTSTIKYVCSGCNTGLFTCIKLRKHESMCLKNIKLTCEKYNVGAGEGKKCIVCNIYCVNEHILDAHMMDYHVVRSDEPVIIDARPCPHCGGRYVCFKFHDCPAKSRPHECPYCYKSFTSTLFRQTHLELSTYYLKSNASGTRMTQALKHSDNYCLLYVCRRCDTDVLFTTLTMCATHLKSHNKKVGIGRILLPTKCFNGDIVNCETTLSVPDKRLVKFMTGIESLPKETLTHALTTPNMTDDVDDDVIILDEDIDIEPPTESVENSKNLDTKDYDIDTIRSQLDEEIVRDLVIEADICKVIQSSKSYRLLVEEESLRKNYGEKSEETKIMNEEFRTKDIMTKESTKTEFLVKGSISEECIKNELIGAEEEICEDNLIIVDNGVEDITNVSDSESKITLENNTEMNNEKEEFVHADQITKVLEHIDGKKHLRPDEKKCEDNLIIVDNGVEDITNMSDSESKITTENITEMNNEKEEFVHSDQVKKVLEHINSKKHLRPDKKKCEDNLMIVDNGVEDITKVSDSVSKITSENNTEMNNEKEEFVHSDQITKVLEHINSKKHLRPDDLIEIYLTADIEEESVTNENTLEKSREKDNIECLDLVKAYTDVTQSFGNNPSIYMDVDVQVDQLYDCKNCDYSGIRSQYIVHVSTECAKTEFSCNLCAHFPTLIDYLKHLTGHGYKPLSCPKCLKLTGSLDELQSHVASHILGLFSDGKSSSSKEMSLYYCIKCGNCVRLECFFKHWQMHVNGLCFTEGEYASESDIDDENGVIVMSQELISEILRILQEKSKTPVKRCIVCLKAIVRGDELKRHLIQHLLAHAMNAAKRETSKIIKCYFCEKKFRRINEWKPHMRKHADLHVYKCPLCTKRFSDFSNFSKHKKVHNLFSYICDICGGKFSKRKSLIQHLKLHENSFSCRIGDNTFISESRLKKHTLLKHNAQPMGRMYSCTACKKRFEFFRDKQEHLWIKHGIRKKMADCPICGKAFRLRVMVKRHMMLKHSIN